MVMDGLKASNVNLGNRLASHDWLLVFSKEAHDFTRCARLHLVEGFHDLDQANRVILRDPISIRFVGWFIWGWLPVEYAWERRKDFLYAHEFLFLEIGVGLP
jgi:hypothetical protein